MAARREGGGLGQMGEGEWEIPTSGYGVSESQERKQSIRRNTLIL